MSDSNSFSIYLLKERFNSNNFDEVLRRKKALTEIPATNIPANAKMYYQVSKSSVPEWTSYWGADIKKENQMICALIFYPVNDRVFVFSYGYAFVFLRDNAIEQDFGLRVATNLLDSKTLRSTDTFEFSSSKKGRTQSPNTSDLFFFDIDSDTTILKSITGKVKTDYSKDYSYITGSNNIRVTSKVPVSNMNTFLQSLLNLYTGAPQKTDFDDYFTQIVPIKTSTVDYEKALIQDLTNKNTQAEIEFSLPELIDFQHFKGFSFFETKDKSKIFEEFTVDNLFELWEKKNKKAKKKDDLLKNCKVFLYNDTEDKPYKSVSLKKCISYVTMDTSKKNKVFLHEGNWYNFSDDYQNRIDSTVNKIFSSQNFNLPKYDKKITDGEGEYNDSLANSTFLVLDRNNVSFKNNQKIEPCDLICCKNQKDYLIHVKIGGTSSSPLGHLFNQGYVSTELLLNDNKMKNEVIQKIKNDTKSKADKNILIEHLKNDEFEVVYAIITKKGTVTDLPLFTKIALVKAWKNLNRLQIKSRVIFIEDIS